MSKTKVSLTPAEISEKWGRRLKASVQDIQRGIDAVTESPAEAAIAKQDKMLTNLTAAVQSGRWAAGLQKVTLADWKSRTKEKVASRIAGGVDGAMTKRRDFDQYLTNTLNQVLTQVSQMPDMTFEDSVNRVRAVMEHMHNNPYKK